MHQRLPLGRGLAGSLTLLLFVVRIISFCSNKSCQAPRKAGPRFVRAESDLFPCLKACRAVDANQLRNRGRILSIVVVSCMVLLRRDTLNYVANPTRFSAEKSGKYSQLSTPMFPLHSPSPGIGGEMVNIYTTRLVPGAPCTSTCLARLRSLSPPLCPRLESRTNTRAPANGRCCAPPWPQTRVDNAHALAKT